MKRSNVNQPLATLVALSTLGVAFTACSSGNDADEASDRPDTPPIEDIDRDDGPPPDGADDESDLVEPPAGEPRDEPADEVEATDDEAIEQDAGADADAEFAPTSPGAGEPGGLFGEEQPTDDPGDDAEDRFDDNTFEDYGYRDFIEAVVDPLSTFALDVDTGSYSVGRRWLDEGALPPIESVRPEEYINAFAYAYDAPRDGLEISVDGGPSPFDPDNLLVRVGVQAETVDEDDRGDAALTFVIDTSGSMDRDDRLGLVKESLSILVDELRDDDTVAIVTYSDDSGIVLEPTPVSERDRILSAIDDLGPGGSTNLEAGLREGYNLAREAFHEGGINRVVLASDGVANSGVTDPDQLADMIRRDADAGIDLVTVGFGMGNFNDVTMEQLADRGDGFYAYVDTEDEAERLFEDELTSTLLTVAKDGKIQVEFDSDVVESYRLIGFENRGVRDNDFRDDEVDAGELGAGHQVTAIYEIELERGIDVDDRAELGVVSLRWEDPETGEVVEIDEDIDMRDIEPEWGETPDDFQLATVVATFAEKLRDNHYAADVDIDDLADEADRLADVYDTDQVGELADLVDRAADMA